MAFARPKNTPIFRRTPARRYIRFAPARGNVLTRPQRCDDVGMQNTNEKEKSIQTSTPVSPSRSPSRSPPKTKESKPSTLPSKVVNLTSDYLISTRLINDLSDLKVKIADVNSEIQKHEMMTRRCRELLRSYVEDQNRCELMEKKIWRWIELMWKPLRRRRKTSVSSVSSIAVSKPPGLTTASPVKSESIRNSSTQRLELYLAALRLKFSVNDDDVDDENDEENILDKKNKTILSTPPKPSSQVLAKSNSNWSSRRNTTPSLPSSPEKTSPVPSVPAFCVAGSIAAWNSYQVQTPQIPNT